MGKCKGYVVTIGSSSLDYYYETEKWPELGDKAMVQSLGVKVGGMISNASCVMARCGLETYLIDLVNPEYEELILGELREYGVHTEQIARSEDVQSMTNIYVAGGEKTIFVCKKKPQITLNQEQIRLICGASAVYTTLLELRKIEDYEDVIRLMKTHGVRLVFDMEPPLFSDTPEDRALIAQADILFFNEMAICKFRGEAEESQSIEALLEQGVEIVVVTRAEKGCSVYAREKRLDVPGLQVKVVDTTGAGDTFNSVFLTAYFNEFSLEDCAALGNAGGARAVTQMGAKSGAAPLEQMEDFMKKMDR